jgi:hypothetical protein
MVGLQVGGIFIYFCFVTPVALRHRNKDPAPFWHPVDVFLNIFVLLSGNILPDIVGRQCTIFTAE